MAYWTGRLTELTGDERCTRRAGVRLHDLRHTFATLQLSAGVHFMQKSKWLGHSTYTLTLDVCGEYISEKDRRAGDAPALEPSALTRPSRGPCTP
jgi:integrase